MFVFRVYFSASSAFQNHSAPTSSISISVSPWRFLYFSNLTIHLNQLSCLQKIFIFHAVSFVLYHNFFCLFVGANVHQLLFVVFLNESCQFISSESLLMYLIQSCKNYAFYTVVKTFIFSSLDRCLLLRILWRVFEFVIISTFLCIIHVVALLHDPSYCFYGSSFLFSALMWYLFFLPWIIYNLLVFSMGHVTHST